MVVVLVSSLPAGRAERERETHRHLSHHHLNHIIGGDFEKMGAEKSTRASLVSLSLSLLVLLLCGIRNERTTTTTTTTTKKVLVVEENDDDDDDDDEHHHHETTQRKEERFFCV